MQFSIIALAAALASTATAVYVPNNGTTAYYPTGTGTGVPTGPTATSSLASFTGAAAPTQVAGSALGLVVAAGVAFIV